MSAEEATIQREERAADLETEINGEVATDVKEKIEKAYMNDDRSELIVERLAGGEDEIVVEMRTPHGGETHTRQFDAPERGSLEECPEFVEFLDGIGVSPLDLDDIAGTSVPARFSERRGWVVDQSRLAAASGEEDADGEEDVQEVSRVESEAERRDLGGWVEENRAELIAAVVFFVMFVAVPASFVLLA